METTQVSDEGVKCFTTRGHRSSKNYGWQPKSRAVAIKLHWGGLGTIGRRGFTYFRVGSLAQSRRNRARLSERGSDAHENGRFAGLLKPCPLFAGKLRRGTD